jgi:translation elongation factor EF-Tu-like GTPase
MEYDPDIEGEVTYIPTEAGGRKSPAFPGYRPQFYYNGNDWDAVQNYPDVDQVKPGETARVFFTFLSPDEHFGKLQPGTIFLIREGTRTIGYGKVTQLLGLEKSAKATTVKYK